MFSNKVEVPYVHPDQGHMKHGPIPRHSMYQSLDFAIPACDMVMKICQRSHAAACARARRAAPAAAARRG
jgi:hypothetical protein